MRKTATLLAALIMCWPMKAQSQEIIKTGWNIGILPVVGVPLPLISYGGTSMVTLCAGFGLLMSIRTHRKITDERY